MQTPTPDSQDEDDVQIVARDMEWMIEAIQTGRLKYMGEGEEEAPDMKEPTDLK